MASAIETLPDIPAEVHELAASSGVTDYLAPILEMTRRLFPFAPICVLLDIDPEIPGDRCVRIEVDVSRNMDVDAMVQSYHQWTDEMFAICPITHSWFFCLGMM